MNDGLRRIAEKYGIGETALRDLTALYEQALPRHPTLRIGDGEAGALPPPMTFGEYEHRYEDRGFIGRGGFSEVREVWDRHVGRIVALKTQLPQRNEPDDCRRARHEVQITARLQHPGVVPLYDWGQLPDERVWFTMKRVFGETIGTRVEALHRLQGAEFVAALRRLLDHFRRLCEPVAYAHAMNIIHRDITPANLMIGQFGEVQVMDWGLARMMSRLDSNVLKDDLSARASESDSSEQRTRIIGTPNYMSPEQASGRIQAMGPPSDVYALGAVLYEILSGQPPFADRVWGPALAERIVERVQSQVPTPIDVIGRVEVPRELFSICTHAMSRAPAERYAHAGLLMEALSNWLDGAYREARARRIVLEAQVEHQARIDQMRADIDELRAKSRAILDKLRSFDKAQDKAEGWQLADDAALVEQAMLREEISYTQKLRSALNEAPMLEEAHNALAEHYVERLLRAEDQHDTAATTSFAALIEDHARYLHSEKKRLYQSIICGDGLLSLDAVPARARVVIKPYELANRYLVLNDLNPQVLETPIRKLILRKGSYLIRMFSPGHHDVAYPVMIGRGVHWDGIRPGSVAPLPIELPLETDLDLDDVYVPGGWTTVGGDPRAGESMPIQRVWVDGFVMRRFPVTNTEFLAFLNRLVAEGRHDEARRHCPRLSAGSPWDDDARFAYVWDQSRQRYALKDPQTEAALPVVFVDWFAAVAYAADWSRRTGLPWRLPSEFEWEKAARGVDGRFMPWGDHLEPTWACVSGSHAERKHVMPVNSYPTDVSPYGIRGMAGNVRDWCIESWQLDGPRVVNDVLQIVPAPIDDDTERPVRGGAWISAGDMMRLAIRYSERPTKRHGVLGFRLVRSFISK